MKTPGTLAGLAGLLALGYAAAVADSLPAGPGLAARHADALTLAADPQVLFAEDFEAGGLADLAKRWTEISKAQGRVLAFSTDTAPGSRGQRSLEMTATLGENTGGHLYARLPRAVETAFARFYVKFAEDTGYLHHFVTLGGYRPATAWPQGGAGERPRGDERVTVGIEPTGDYGRFPAPGIWNFYAYWPEMKGSADGRFWGNSLKPIQPAVIPRGQWQCVEFMLKLNATPAAHDGELALWLDGKLAAHFRPGVPRGRWTGMGFDLVKSGGDAFEGFRWRAQGDLKINFFWLLDYVTENASRQNGVAKPPRVSRVWFDDIVVATGYVGPNRP